MFGFYQQERLDCVSCSDCTHACAVLPNTKYLSCTHAGTTLQPQTITGYEGERLSYTCETSCGEKFWKINGSFAQWETEYPYRAIINEGRISTLSVEASAATNNSVVTCFLNNPPNNEESSATITVQGIIYILQSRYIIMHSRLSIYFAGTIAEPTNLRLTYNEKNIYLSWIRPHTLPNTQSIFAINLSVFNCSNFSFTTANTQVSFSYTSLNIDRCNSDHTVSISVHGVNRAGEGEPSFVQAVIPQSQEENCSQGDRLNVCMPIILKDTILYL